MQNILQIVEQKFTDVQFNVNWLMDHTGLTHSRLYELFIEYLEIPPHTYIENKRLELAIRLMCEIKVNTITLCRQVGYGNCRTFRLAFRRRFGQTPSGIQDAICEGKCPDKYIKTLWEK